MCLARFILGRSRSCLAFSYHHSLWRTPNDGIKHKKLLAFLLFFDRDNFAALIMSTIGANSVRWAHFTAIGTGHNSYRSEGVVRAPAIAATA
jgi:hypothetical protein